MPTLEKELENTRKRWLEAQKRGDQAMLNLWEKVGNSIKARIAERIGKPQESSATSEQIEKIFDGKLEI